MTTHKSSTAWMVHAYDSTWVTFYWSETERKKMRKKASLNLHAIRSSVMRSINVQCTCMSSMGVDLILCGVCMQADTCLCRCLHFFAKKYYDKWQPNIISIPRAHTHSDNRNTCSRHKWWVDDNAKFKPQSHKLSHMHTNTRKNTMIIEQQHTRHMTNTQTQQPCK